VLQWRARRDLNSQPSGSKPRNTNHKSLSWRHLVISARPQMDKFGQVKLV
jgi:hypothetical protein